MCCCGCLVFVDLLATTTDVHVTYTEQCILVTLYIYCIDLVPLPLHLRCRSDETQPASKYDCVPI